MKRRCLNGNGIPYARFPGLAYPCRMQHEAKKTLSINKASFLILKVITIGGTSLDFKIVY